MLFVLVSSLSCRNTGENEGQSQMQRVMAVHDEVMPEMKTIANLVGELQPKVDSIGKGLEYGRAVKDLQDSHKAMFDWMKGFGERFTHDEILNGAPLSEEKQRWLDEEEEKVKELKEQILGSIERAEELANQD